jgi:hypothetical protein
MSYKLTRNLLATEVNTFATTNNLSVVYPNIDSQFGVSDEYLEFILLFSTPDNKFLVGGDRILGVLQINIYTPKSIGDGRNYEIVDLLEDYFADSQFTDTVNNFYLTIDMFYPGNNGESTIEQDKFKNIININFQAWRD